MDQRYEINILLLNVNIKKVVIIIFHNFELGHYNFYETIHT